MVQPRVKLNVKSGFALIASAIFMFVLFAFSLSFLDLLVGDKRFAMYARNFQTAEAIAEAGVEEVMWEYNFNGSGFAGWTLSGSTASKNSAGFNSFGDYTVSVSDYNTENPIVTSTCPFTYQGHSQQVQIKCALVPQKIFSKAVKAKSTIDISGLGNIDSYDSSLGAYGGANVASNGDIQSNSNASPAIAVSGTVNGDVNTGSSGTVAQPGGVITGIISHTANEVILDNDAPSIGTVSASLTSTQTITVSPLNTQYRCLELDLSGSETVTFGGSGTFVLYLTGSGGSSFSLSGNSAVIIEPGVNLIIYADANVNVAGGGIVNNNGMTQPLSLQIYGTPTCTDVQISGNGDFVGVVSAPQATVTVSGNGNIYGAVVAETFTSTGNGSLHYDEALANNSPVNGMKLRWYTRR